MSVVRNEDVRVAVANLRADLAEQYGIIDAPGRNELLLQIEAAARELRLGK